MSIDLATGRTGQGSLQVASWIGDSKQRPFDWRYLLSVAGGGLVERKGQFDFQAPVDGYQPAIEVNMAATAEQWTSRLTRQYFARLADGRHARFSIRFYAGSRVANCQPDTAMTLPKNVAELQDKNVVFELECIDRMYLNPQCAAVGERTGRGSLTFAFFCHSEGFFSVDPRLKSLRLSTHF